MEAGTLAGVSMSYLQSGASCALRNGEATPGRQFTDGIGRLNVRFCNPRVFSDRLGGRSPPGRSALQIRASHASDNTFDANGVATLELPSNNGSRPSRKEDGRERLEALVEQVCAIVRVSEIMR